MITKSLSAGQRFSTRLAPDGRWAVTARLAGNAAELELWNRTTGGFVAQETGVAIDPADQLLPLGDAWILVCSSAGRVHFVDVIDRAALCRRRVATFASQTARVLPAAKRDPDRRPWALCRDEARTALSRFGLDADGMPYKGGQPCLSLPGTYTGGVWTNICGRSLALWHSVGGQPCSSVELSIADGRTRVLFSVTHRSNDLFQQWAPETNLAVVSTDAGGTQRLGYRHLRGEEDWIFPDELAAPGGLIEAVAIDPGGTLILTHEQRGVRSLLHCFDVVGRRQTPLPIVPGSLHGDPVWTKDGILAPWSTPEVPLTFLEFGPGPQVPPPSNSTRGSVQVVTIPGAAAPIEGIAYGGQDWMQLPRLLVALHGGPLESWRLEYDPLFDQMARSGVGVLAINPRGSSGYGYAFASAILAGWGGADLDDVLAVGRFLRARRQTDGLGLFGVSYGAFLALLATCLEPSLWECCAALSGFASPASLYADAGEPVRRLIAHTGGLKAPTGLDRPWDVRALAGRATARVLIVHGRYDETIGIQHARDLAAAFESAGGTYNTRAVYQEISHAGHDLDWPDVRDLVCRFVQQPGTPI